MAKSVDYPLKKKILIADDNSNNLQLLVNYLSDYGYKILISYSGKKTIQIALAVHLDLILLDVMMPEVDGFETCRHLKTNAKTKDIPIIFMTALADTKDKVKGFKLGAVDYITKPIEQAELLARIQTHLSLQSLHQRLAKDAARQKLLFEISDRIHQSLDLQSILQTATKDIRVALACDFVGLARLNNEYASFAASSPATDINFELETSLPYNYVCPYSEKYQSGDCTNCDFSNEPCHKIYLQAKIPVVEEQETNTFFQPTFSLQPQKRLIIPILINSTKLSANFAKTQLVPTLGKKTSPKSPLNNTLWGWLIVIRSQSSPKWEMEEIDILEKITIQLAIGIKQGLLYQQLSQLALLDPLTQVFNRRYFDRQLNLEWRRLKRISSPLSLIMCDVDFFKIYNDTYGHQEGDECLQQIALAISSAIKRPADILARYGGEEFTVILPNTPVSGAIKVAEDIRVAVKELNIPHHNSLVDSVVTISLGIASTVPNSEDNPNLLLEASDLALYKAKERGRDCIAVYPSPISQSKDRQELELQWVKRLRQALQDNLFSLYAQPIEPLEIDDPKKYFEILLRLTDEQERVISPNVFLDIAERHCLMSDIDSWVIDNLLETLAGSGDYSCWQNYRFAINLSGASLNSESFLELLRQKLIDYQLPAYLFCLEITETIAVSNLAKVASFINSLKRLGCSFALDDFGKGMSSLTYLKNLPVDYLKIDGSFIKELNHNQASKVMVEAIKQGAALLRRQL